MTEFRKNGSLKDKVARGVAWSMAEKIGSMLLQMAVSLVILRLLTREDFGVMAILTAVSAVALVLVDSGFSQMLIRKENLDERDCKSVFFFNIAVSLALYLLFLLLTPMVARYYEMPELVELAPIFFLLLPVNALCSVQNALFVRQFRFALLSKITFISALVSGLLAVGLALAGAGVWSVVLQRLMQVVVRVALLWWLGEWRPRGQFESRVLRQMAPYSFSLMTTDLITTFYNKIPQFALGRLYPADTLGAFDQAVKLKDQPVTSAMQAVQSVTFPALSKLGNDPQKFAESYRQVVMVVTYLLFPIMLGLSAVAQDLFAALLGAEWMPTAPYFEIVCLAGLFYPIAMVAFNVLKARSDGKIIVRIELLKKVLMTLIFAITIPFSVEAVVWGLVAISCCEMVVNVSASLRYTTLTWGRLLHPLFPIVLVSGGMYISVCVVSQLLFSESWLRLLVGVTTGVVCYLVLSVIFRLEAFREVIAILRKQLKRE